MQRCLDGYSSYQFKPIKMYCTHVQERGSFNIIWTFLHPPAKCIQNIFIFIPLIRKWCNTVTVDFMTKVGYIRLVKNQHSILFGIRLILLKYFIISTFKHILLILFCVFTSDCWMHLYCYKPIWLTISIEYDTCYYRIG